MPQQKNLKLHDLTDAIISKDLAHPLHPHAAYIAMMPPGIARYAMEKGQMIQQGGGSKSDGQPMGQEKIIATEQWNLNRRLIQQQQKEDMAKGGNNGPGSERSTPDDRHIIRMAQTPSPRNKIPYEAVSPPDSMHYYQQQQQQQQQQQPKPMITINPSDQRRLPPGASMHENNPAGDGSMIFKFVNDRIAEKMRQDGTANDHHDGKQQQQQRENEITMKTIYERPRSGNNPTTGGNGMPEMNDNEKNKREMQQHISQSSRPPPPQQFQGPAMAFMYPYSALTVPPGGPNLIISPKTNELIERQQQGGGGGPPPTQHLETRQVMSEQYDALSDED